MTDHKENVFVLGDKFLSAGYIKPFELNGYVVHPNTDSPLNAFDTLAKFTPEKIMERRRAVLDETMREGDFVTAGLLDKSADCLQYEFDIMRGKIKMPAERPASAYRGVIIPCQDIMCNTATVAEKILSVVENDEDGSNDVS